MLTGCVARKILSLRLFDAENGKKWDKSVVDKEYEVLCVSQFTLHRILKGNKLDFHDAMGPDLAPQFYENFLQLMKQNYAEDKIKNGVFGADMQVHIQNDGPVTIPLESPENLPEPKVRKPQGGKNANQNQSSSSLSKEGQKQSSASLSDSVETATENAASGDS
ncbi:D-aminoacyl-tRNA deacylase 1-like isoform X2 [Mya arenaria]|uniref:D-aminoacyl-tRNA deacylase 1-like isoform X2 n=1 Tax=Mya arenaria TaxID=6604 RepID=UPI0022E6A4BA|nr:D-aminoacyl-tRNA deacylase 1-like isoform X2 [Mya arenaria]